MKGWKQGVRILTALRGDARGLVPWLLFACTLIEPPCPVPSVTSRGLGKSHLPWAEVTRRAGLLVDFLAQRCPVQ